MSNICAFLRTVEVLPKDEIAGFIRYEVDGSGKRCYSTIHSHFHWIPEGAKSRGPYTFARITHDHSACWLVTRDQLETAIVSGGFLVEPHMEEICPPTYVESAVTILLDGLVDPMPGSACVAPWMLWGRGREISAPARKEV
jgi:hypothetical protein